MVKPAEIKIDTTKALKQLKSLRKEAEEIQDLFKIPVVNVNLNDGDILVLTHHGILSERAYEIIKKSVSECFNGLKVMVLEEGMRVSSCIKFNSDNNEEHF